MGFWKRKGKSARKGSRAAAGSIQKRREIAEPLEPRYLLSTLPFTFNLATPASTSAGVYNSAGTLVRTLWSGVSGAQLGLAQDVTGSWVESTRWADRPCFRGLGDAGRLPGVHRRSRAQVM